MNNKAMIELILEVHSLLEIMVLLLIIVLIKIKEI
jgi:hypothetical protein